MSYCNNPKFLDRHVQANNVDQDQTAPEFASLLDALLYDKTIFFKFQENSAVRIYQMTSLVCIVAVFCARSGSNKHWKLNSMISVHRCRVLCQKWVQQALEVKQQD